MTAEMDSWLTPPNVDAKPIPMPEGFQPNAHHRVLAIQLDIDLEEAFATFVDHHASKEDKFKSWDRALSTWLRREKQFSRQRPSDSQFVFKTPEPPPCSIGFCDGSGWFVDSRTRRTVYCECRRRTA
jgi:hypothetical protein